MSCKYFVIRENKNPMTAGHESLQITENLCGLKLEGGQKRSDVHEILVAEGYESDFITDDCPFAEKKNFEWCPFCESY